MLVTPADGGMRFELYKDDRLAASGSAQQVPGHAFIYFFNDADGSAYLFASNNGDMELYSFGYFELKVPAPNAKGGFEDIAGTWYLGGDPNAESILDIDNNGEWVLYEGSAVVDSGYLVQHHQGGLLRPFPAERGRVLRHEHLPGQGGHLVEQRK